MFPTIHGVASQQIVAGGGGGEGISYVAAAFDPNLGVSRDTITINKPTGTAENDVMLTSIGYRGTFAVLTITPPTGWTLVRETTGGSGDPNIATYVKVAGGSEPASYEWGLDSTRTCAGGTVAFRGVDTANPIAGHAGVFDTTNNDPYPSADCGDGDAAVFVMSEDSNGLSEAETVPSGATLAYGPGEGATSVGFNMAAAYELGQSSPSTGSRSPQSVASGDFTLHVVALKAGS